MAKDVLINIKGTVISENSPPDIIELTTAGRYSSKDGNYYISYKESEATGLEGITTTLKVEGESSVTLMRNGAATSRLVLEKGRRHLCHYDTGYGQLMVGVSGCKIKSQLSDLGGDLAFFYTLDINSSLISQNEVFITVKEANKKDVKPYQYSN
ncbi:MAG TPA: DUF1934 domain-containing protein [Clostridia bacterium]|nr:DUF1934 domain-containing protein [Clostridia bacterium]